MKFGWLVLLAGTVCQVGCSIFVPDFPPQKGSDGAGKFHGEVVVSSAPLAVKGPPKGFPLLRTERKQRSLDLEERGKGGMSKIMKKIWPYMLVPAMMSMGYAPFMLSSLKMFVMSAVMVNMMALNAAIFLTLRNIVFGPRVGQHTRYYNFGYKKKTKHHNHFR